MLTNKTLISEIKNIISHSREKAVRSVDNQRTLMYWHIGQRIFEEEQHGEDRAEYGTYLIKSLSEELQPEFGSGFSYRQLNWYRQFYKTFPIVSALRTQLNWTQYKLLTSIDDEHKREYYIAESVKNNWSARQLERQINSSLYERLLISNDKESVLAIAKGDVLPIEPLQIIKDPMILEFLGLKRESAYYEKDFEQAIITHLQDFLLELGNGFSFVARQKRIHLDGDDFFVDLVFYNRLMQCFVLFEIKTKKLNHEDLGQLQMYVNYFDRKEKLEHENKTIGILLCADKNNSLVKFTLPENNKSVLASKYELYLPTESQLLEALKMELDEFQTNENKE
ncbi:PDDEXK nuclease domain-containing protein [Frigoriflavimonas asaccharolytica]|uniref:Putative nuclease of restriction endonuclease-like (RecB) superfamily n=1 Tax=Frigoriflavimonas asaccharolytica TaxID=2735899 RepID=A0A8J8G900_9FLAO|nr:PDDEXK nuclease domain-containing protein [Frigoriflavimonas asaccharolytica]NRS93126.1 putative nuclease of restriction endonuclease-like (RecB) superfamily [Frigoriflavimonas asaccharolytica]